MDLLIPNSAVRISEVVGDTAQQSCHPSYLHAFTSDGFEREEHAQNLTMAAAIVDNDLHVWRAGRWCSFVSCIFFGAKIYHSFRNVRAMDASFERLLAIISLIGMPGSGLLTFSHFPVQIRSFKAPHFFPQSGIQLSIQDMLHHPQFSAVPALSLPLHLEHLTSC